MDNHYKVWLWRGPLKVELDEGKINKQLTIAKHLVDEYVKQKKCLDGFDREVKYVIAGEEPIEFTNIFPYWK